MEKWKYCHDKDFDAADADSEKGEEEIEVEFISNYVEEDIVDLFNELFADELLPAYLAYRDTLSDNS